MSQLKVGERANLHFAALTPPVRYGSALPENAQPLSRGSAAIDLSDFHSTYRVAPTDDWL